MMDFMAKETSNEHGTPVHAVAQRTKPSGNARARDRVYETILRELQSLAKSYDDQVRVAFTDDSLPSSDYRLLAEGVRKAIEKIKAVRART